MFILTASTSVPCVIIHSSLSLSLAAIPASMAEQSVRSKLGGGGVEPVGTAGDTPRSKRGGAGKTLVGGAGTPWAFEAARLKLGGGRVADAALVGWVGLLAAVGAAGSKLGGGKAGRRCRSCEPHSSPLRLFVWLICPWHYPDN